MIKDNPDLEDALDGLYHAHVYALDIGEEELASEIFDLYQRMGEIAPEDDWEWTAEDGLKELDIYPEQEVSAQEAMTRNPRNEEEDYD